VNKILNYFVFENKGAAFVLKAPVTINAEIAKKLLEKQTKAKQSLPLHICLDADSGYVYSPNKSSFSKDTAIGLFKAAQFEILKEYPNIPISRVIDGSPFSALRIRSINSFTNMAGLIKKNFGIENFNNLPVLEVNLERMPSLLDKLPPIYKQHSNYLGGYIGRSHAKSIEFKDEISNDGEKRKFPIPILQQETPFILINISRNAKPNPTEKEWTVLMAYREHLQETKQYDLLNGLSKFADLYAIKRNLYLGWSFEEVTAFLLDQVDSFGSLLKALSLLKEVAGSLEEEGYKNPASIPYYMVFKIDPVDFPLNLDFLKNNRLVEKQPDYFEVVGYDYETSYIIIRTNALIMPRLCDKLLKAKSRVFVAKYDDVYKKILVKSESSSYGDLKLFNQGEYLKKVKYLYAKHCDLHNLEYEVGSGSYGVKGANPDKFIKRKISDYYYATDFIKSMCVKYKVDFNDFEVVLGPIERLFGRGTRGGFMGKVAFIKSGLKTPHKITDNLFVTPPVIFIDSMTEPSYAEQTETLIHEYRHYIYSIQHSYYENEYGKEQKDSHKKWFLYFKDDNEIAAHKAQIQYLLKIGRSVDEIIRDKVEGQVTEHNYQVALRFAEIVEDGIKEMEGL